MREPLWQRLFPDEDFRWAMNLRPGEPGSFFRPTPHREKILAMRERQLDEAAEHCARFEQASDSLVSDALELVEPWTGCLSGLDQLARVVESDWVLLEPDEAGQFRIVAGAVCFPSHWSLPEKMGLPLAAVHEPVARLNDSLGRSIDAFLAKLSPGTFWERENWGMTADERLDQHPRHELIALDGSQQLDAVWIRLEQQFFARLAGGGVYFGIAVSNHRLDVLIDGEPCLAPRIARALRSMPEDVAAYKSLAKGRGALVQQLEKRITSP